MNKINFLLKSFLKNKKITILDYLLILLFVSGIAFYFLFFKRGTDMIYVDVFSPSPVWTEDSYPVSRWQTSAINKGDVQYNSFGQEIMEVVDVYKTPWNAGKQEYMFVTLKLKATYNKNMKVYSFNGNPLLFGNDFLLEANSSSLEGRIVNVYRSKEERDQNFEHKKAIIKVVYRLQEPSVAAKLLTKSELYDSNGILMLKIIDVKVSAAEEFYPNWQGQVIKSFNPEKKDVTVEMEIPDVECTNYNCFYNHYFPLTVGWDFPIDFGDLTMSGKSVITDVQYGHER